MLEHGQVKETSPSKLEHLMMKLTLMGSRILGANTERAGWCQPASRPSPTPCSSPSGPGVTSARSSARISTPRSTSTGKTGRLPSHCQPLAKCWNHWWQDWSYFRDTGLIHSKTRFALKGSIWFLKLHQAEQQVVLGSHSESERWQI